ncbi:MAG TPA: GNAT family N-acetyltransferase [Mycobacteriales bacterium]|nr:GNAT family N-acetyltransferase [Mycobacteriales bacterium]
MSTGSSAVEVRLLDADDDFDALNVGNPMAPTAMFLWRSRRPHDPESHWFAGLLDSVPVGFAAARSVPVTAAGYGSAIIAVRPEARRRGVASALREAVAEACRGRVPGVGYRCLAGHADTAATIAAWNLEITDKSIESVLDLREIDRGAYELMAAAPGVGMRTAGDLDEASWREVYDFVADRFRETPDFGGAGQGPRYEAFRAMLPQPWMVLLGYESGRLIGVTFAGYRAGDAAEVNTILTGVVADARGRGVATGLKARHALMLADRGVARIYTQNMAGNAPIRAANEHMGFAVVAEHLIVRETY